MTFKLIKNVISKEVDGFPVGGGKDCPLAFLYMDTLKRGEGHREGEGEVGRREGGRRQNNKAMGVGREL